MLDLIVSTIIPRLATQWKKDTSNCISQDEQQEAAAATSPETVNENRTVAPDNQETINESFLKAHRLKSMSFSTTWRWMRLLGFKDDA